MRTLVFLCTFAIASQCAATERDVSVFIAPRSSLVPASGKVIIDVYWFNSSKRPRAVPNLESYSVMQSINSRSGKGLGRAEGGAHIVDHPSADRLIPARTMLRDEIVIEVKITADEFVEMSAEFWGTQCGTFRSNSVILTKRR